MKLKKMIKSQPPARIIVFGFAVTIAEPAVTVLESNEKRVLLSVADNEKLKKFIKEQKKKCLSLYRVTELSYLCR